MGWIYWVYKASWPVSIPASWLRNCLIMKMLLVACLAALASPALSKCVGSINVKDFGEVFIVAPDWSVGAVTIHDNGFTLRGNSRIYFASRCDDGWNGDMYAQVQR